MSKHSLIRGSRPLFLAILLATSGAGAAPASERVGGVLILRNGNILEGVVRPAGAYYRVEQAGATMQVPVNQVETVCGSLNEAYEVRRSNRVGSSVDSNLELARWCLRHNMLDQAAREILDARIKDANHPALKLLDLQLRQQMEVVARKSHASEPKPAAPGPGVVLASHEQRLPTGPEPLAPSTESQAEFIRSVQPMLVFGCATGGCHQPGSRQKLQLDRWALEGNGNPTLIRQNLGSVLAYINRDDPPSSPLMRWARQSHGVAGARPSAPLASYQAGILLEWLNQVCGVQTATLEHSAEADSQAPPTPLAEGPRTFPGGDAGTAPPFDRTGATTIGAATAGAPPYQPRDPFDAEAFNRRRAEARRAPRENGATAHLAREDDEPYDASSESPPSEIKSVAGEATSAVTTELRTLPPASE